MSEWNFLIPSNAKPPQKAIRVLGIDLGTTNSVAAELTWEPGLTGIPKARCLEVEQWTTEGDYIHLLLPSVVALYQGQAVVGEGAKRLRARCAELELVRNRNLFFDCKNDMGLRETYHRAPEGFRSAAAIGGRVLGFLSQAAEKASPMPLDRTVVTVPASFQIAQRRDTQEAADLAGIALQGGDLLDEPVAVFLDYLVEHPEMLDRVEARGCNLLVFDFGGGTCDVAIFRLSQEAAQAPLGVAPLAVSRYHRLGGGDIDAAIVHEVLLPQILEQNELDRFDLGFREKKNIIEPAFMSTAEALKISLCTEIARLKKFGKYTAEKRETLTSRIAGLQECLLDGRRISLQSPQISAIQFDELLKPFLDTDLLETHPLVVIGDRVVENDLYIAAHQDPEDYVPRIH